MGLVGALGIPGGREIGEREDEEEGMTGFSRRDTLYVREGGMAASSSITL